MDGDSAESLRAALEAGTLSPAEYVQRARTAGIDTSTVASVLRSTVVAASCNKSSASDQAPVGDAESDSLTSALPAEPGSAEASLAWLRARPENWARRAAERLAPDNDFLIDLDLYDAGLLNDEAVGHLATALAANSTVSSVSLNNTQITDAVIEPLCRALQSTRAVTSLDLGRNKLASAGANALAEWLASDGCALQTLELSSNPDLTEESKDQLRRAWGARDADKLHF